MALSAVVMKKTKFTHEFLMKYGQGNIISNQNAKSISSNSHIDSDQISVATKIFE